MRFHDGIVNIDGVLHVGGVSVAELVRCYDTPLYIYDESSLRNRCREIIAASAEYPEMTVYYASKAFPNTGVGLLFYKEGMGIDAASEGELLTALRSGVPGSDIILHGVGKSASYLDLGIKHNAIIVIDSLSEIDTVATIAARQGATARCYLRVNPGVAGDSIHPITTAGNTKFGIPVVDGRIYKAIRQADDNPNISLIGLHCHVGSQLGCTDIYRLSGKILLSVMKKANAAGANLTGINLGGGFGVYYRQGYSPEPLDMGNSIREIIGQMRLSCQELSLPLPHLSLELGRSLVAEAAVAVYTVSTVKEVPWLVAPSGDEDDIVSMVLNAQDEDTGELKASNYAIIDGGLFENPRPLFYGAVYNAVLPLKLNEPADRVYTISGMSCETDTLIEEIALPQVNPGDLLAMPSAGAYQVAMSSNYQRMPKPAVVMVHDGVAKVIQRRQTIDEVLALDGE